MSLIQRARKPKFFQKILLLMLTLSVLPLAAVWYMNYQNANAQITENIDKRMSALSDRLASQVGEWVNMHLKLLRQNAALSDIASMDANKQEPVLRTILAEYQWSYLVFVTGMNGVNVSRTDELDPAKFDYNDRVYFSDVARNGKSYGKQAIVSKSTFKPSLVLSVPVFRYENNARKIVGVMAIGVSRENLSDQIGNVKIGESGYAFLLDEKGKVLAHQNKELAKTEADFSKHPTFVSRPDSGKKFITYEDNGKKVAAYVQKTEHDWYIVTQQDQDELYAPLSEANNKAVMVLVATAVSVTLVAYLFAFGISRPIRQLTAAANLMSRGEMIKRIPAIERSDEIGELAAAVDRMGASLRLAMGRVVKPQGPPAQVLNIARS